MIYFTDHYRLAHGAVSALIVFLGVGALAGVIGGGRLSEWLLNRGRLTARVTLPAIALIAAVPFLGFGIWTTSVWIGFLLLTGGSLVLAAAVAPIDAARLDIVHPRLWGRAEAGGMAARSAFEGSAPLLFGALSSRIGGGNQDAGLMWTFRIMLLPMIAASLLVLRTYPRDVATASVEALSAQDG